MLRLTLLQNLSREMARTADSQPPLLEIALLLEEVRKKVAAGEKIELSLEDKKRLYVATHALSTVYFIAAPDAGMIKIGKTTNLEKRLATLRTMSPVTLEPICTIDYDDNMEARIHRHLSEYRSHGEWFFADKPVLDFIRCYRNQGLSWLVDKVGDAGPYWMNGRGGVSDGMKDFMSQSLYEERENFDPDYRPNTQNTFLTAS